MTPDTKGAALPLWLKLVLAGSLALNLLIAGVVAGAWLSPDGPRGKRIDEAARDVGATPFVRALSPEDRRGMVRAMRDHDDALRFNRDEMRLRFDALLGALRAERFDPAEVTSLLGLQRSAAIARQEIGEQVLVDRLSLMTPEERAAFADRLEASIRRGDGPRPGN